MFVRKLSFSRKTLKANGKLLNSSRRENETKCWEIDWEILYEKCFQFKQVCLRCGKEFRKITQQMLKRIIIRLMSCRENHLQLKLLRCATATASLHSTERNNFQQLLNSRDVRWTRDENVVFDMSQITTLITVSHGFIDSTDYVEGKRKALRISTAAETPKIKPKNVYLQPYLLLCSIHRRQLFLKVSSSSIKIRLENKNNSLRSMNGWKKVVKEILLMMKQLKAIINFSNKSLNGEREILVKIM